MATLEKLDRDSWRGVVDAPLAVLIVGKSDCASCSAWAAELSAWLESSTEWTDVRYGKLDLDQPGLVEFKRANPWVSSLDALPHTSIWRDGVKVKEWLGGGVPRMLSRLGALTTS
ncbi:MAG: hypothetical protein H6697_07325 [Myxococcales bacterium]|nr:hypothetical protein [Myxococcales bacterium]